MRQTYPKQVRLRKKSDFRLVLSQKNKVFGKYLVIDYKKSENSHSRLGISVSSKYASAIQRNLFKRRIREIFRLHQHQFPCVDINVSPRKLALQGNFAMLQEEFQRLLASL